MKIWIKILYILAGLFFTGVFVSHINEIKINLFLAFYPLCLLIGIQYLLFGFSVLPANKLSHWAISINLLGLFILIPSILFVLPYSSVGDAAGGIIILSILELFILAISVCLLFISTIIAIKEKLKVQNKKNRNLIKFLLKK